MYINGQLIYGKHEDINKRLLINYCAITDHICAFYTDCMYMYTKELTHGDMLLLYKAFLQKLQCTPTQMTV